MQHLSSFNASYSFEVVQERSKATVVEFYAIITFGGACLPVLFSFPIVFIASKSKQNTRELGLITAYDGLADKIEKNLSSGKINSFYENRLRFSIDAESNKLVIEKFFV